MKRLAAVVAAALLVAGGFAVWSARQGDGSGKATAGGGASSGDTLWGCIPELVQACRAADVGRVVEVIPGALTPDTGVDAWITYATTPEYAEAANGSGSDLALGTAVPLAEQPLGAALAQSAEPCADKPRWSCLVDLGAGSKIALGPRGSANEVVALGALAAASVVDGAPSDPADLSASDIDIGRLGAVVLSPDANRGNPDISQQLTFLVTQPGRYAAAVSPETGARAIAKSAQGKNLDLRAVVPAPTALVRAVAVPVGGHQLSGDDLDALRAALRDAGFGAATNRSLGLPTGDVTYAVDGRLP